MLTLSNQHQDAAWQLLPAACDEDPCEHLEMPRFLAWFDEPLASFKGLTPRQLVEGHANDVATYLISICDGFIGQGRPRDQILVTPALDMC